MDDDKKNDGYKGSSNRFDFKSNVLQLTLLTEMFDSFSEAVVVANIDRKIIYMNDTFAELFGYQKQELYGQQTKILYANEVDFSEQGNKRFNINAKSTPDSYRVSYQRKGGAQFLGVTSGTTMRNASGEVVGYIAFIRSARSAEQSLDTLQHIHNITSNVGLTYDQRVQDLLQVGLNHFGFEIAIISHITGSDYVVESCVDINSELKPATCFDISGTYCVHTLKANKTLGFHFTGKSEIKNHPCYQNFKLESYIGTPIKVDGKLYGTVNFSSHFPTEPFCKDDYTLMGILADTLSFIIYKKISEQELLLLATTDELTGLLNRRATLERLDEQMLMSKRVNYSLCIISIDIDHFKQINDMWGHAAGDKALVEFSRIMSTLGRKTDFCGRIGGEEFIFVMPGSDETGAIHIANSLREKLQENNIKLNEEDAVKLTFSAGLAVYENKESVETLLMRADQAMYQAKKQGRDQVCLAEIIEK
ncbi:diguanylate cyclase [Psychromonas arctica]|uniref:bifunctional diguanylate cyclase/phosphodiesterase n=1 Tax=Psychromonas arctica TaxID=168275 RepID=UPI002FD1A0A1